MNALQIKNYLENKKNLNTLNILPLCSPAQLAYRIDLLKIHTFRLHGLKWTSVLLFCPLRILNGRKGYTCMKKLSMSRTILWKEAAQVHVVKPSVLQQGSYKQPSPRNDPLHILIPQSFLWPVCKSVIWLGPESTKDCLIMVSQYIQFSLISTEHVPMQCLYFGYKCSQVHCNSLPRNTCSYYSFLIWAAAARNHF